MARSFGTFLLLIGFFLAVLFVTTEMSGQVNFDYFFTALLFLVTGMLMRRRREPVQDSGRFRLFRKKGKKDKTPPGK